MKNNLKYFGASVIAELFILFGFTKRAISKAKQNENILSIYFHNPSKKLFEFCIQWLLKNNFSFLSQEDLYSIYKNSRPFPKSSVIITVDDGWQNNEENIADVANQYKIPVAIFVSTEPVENGNYWWSYIEHANNMKSMNLSIEYLKKIPNNKREAIVNEIKKINQLPRDAMTPEQIKKIASSKYITIGSHTVSHPILTNCDDEQVCYELKASKQKIEEWVKKEVVFFAYPNGDYSKREVQYVEEAGYLLAYSVKPAYITKQSMQNRYELPRFNVYEGISKAEAVCRMLGIWQKFF